ncbi:MAG: hypothetical protein ACTS6H_00740 [Candidatus Hodgkinia cicadicola]
MKHFAIEGTYYDLLIKITWRQLSWGGTNRRKRELICATSRANETPRSVNNRSKRN